MSDIIGLLSTAVGAGLQLKDSIDQNNRQSHRLLASRISTSLGKLRSTVSGIKNPSAGFVAAVKKLKLDLEHALAHLNVTPTLNTGKRAQLKHWWQRDTITLTLQGIEKQISNCFHEFTVLSNVRIEKAIGDHNTQVNHKLDELLRRTAPTHSRPRSSSTSKADETRAKSLTNTDQRRRSSSITTREPRRRSQSLTSSEVQAPPSRPPRRSTDPTPAKQSRTPEIHLLKDEAREHDEECKRLRSEKLPKEALIPARKSLSIRRRLYSLDSSTRNKASLAHSLGILGRCLKESNIFPKEALDLLKESSDLYGALFRQDKDGDYRLEYATSLYNLSVFQNEVALSSSSEPSTGLLSSAESNADLCVIHFRKLYQSEGGVRQYASQLTNAYLNLSFILTDLGRHEKAFAIARRAVEVSSTIPREEKGYLMNRAMMRVVYALKDLGRWKEAEWAEEEAEVVKRM